MSNEAIVRRGHGWLGVALAVALAVAGTGCPTSTDRTTAETPTAVELPPMSEGTLQALGPHVFAAETRVEPAEGSSRKPRTERIELRWMDREHYHLQHWLDGVRHSEEIRDDRWLLVRKGEGPFLWQLPDPGPTVLRNTMVPGNRMLGDVELVAALAASPSADAGAQHFTLALRPELVPADAAAGTALEERYAATGATMLPVGVEGDISVDEHGNRTGMRVVYRYRVAAGGSYETAVVTKTHEETRVPSPEGLDLEIPPEAAVLFAEARAAQEDEAPTAR